MHKLRLTRVTLRPLQLAAIVPGAAKSVVTEHACDRTANCAR